MKPRGASGGVLKALMWVAAVGVAVLYLLPLIWMFSASLRPEAAIFGGGFVDQLLPGPVDFSNYRDAWRRADLAVGVGNSLLQVGLIIGVGLIANSMAAFAFARFEFPGREWLFALVVILIILPIEVLAVPLLLTVRDLGLKGSYAATMGALTLPFMAKAFNIYFLRQHFLALPASLEEAAIIDGAGPWRVYWSVAMPSIRPALATVVVFDALIHWGDYIWPLIVCVPENTRTVQIKMANLFTQPPVMWGDILAAAVIATIPVLIVFAVCQRYIISTEFQSGIR